MSATDAAHRSLWRTSDVMIAATLAAAAVHGLMWSWPFEHTIAMRVFGVVLGIAGVALFVAAKLALARHAQPSAPKRPTTRIVETGIFAHTRNPTYLGVLLLMTGVGLAGVLPWLLVWVGPLAVALHVLLVLPEEVYLMRRFGDVYRAYVRSTPRWSIRPWAR